MREMSIVVVWGAKLRHRCKMSTTTTPTPRVCIMDGVELRAIRHAGILMLWFAIIVVCEQGHGRSIRDGRVIVRRWLNRDGANFVRRGAVEHAANGPVVGL